jgi:histone H3/H4
MAIHEEVLSTARRICRERGEKTFRVADIVHALPHLNPSSSQMGLFPACGAGPVCDPLSL